MAIDPAYLAPGNAVGQMVEGLQRNQFMNAQMASQAGQDQRAQATFDLQQQAAQAQAAQQQQYNALLAQYLGPQQGAMAAQESGPVGQPQQGGAQGNNALLGQLYQMNPERTTQLVQFQSAQQAAAEKQQQEHAQQVVRSAQFVLASKAPKQLMTVAFPGMVEGLKKQGIDVEAMNNEQVLDLANQTIAHYGPMAGVGPVRTENDQFAKINPGDYTPESVAKFQQTGNFADLRKAQAVAATDANQGFNRANVLRDEFNAANKDFSTVQAQYGNILSTAKTPSAAGDLSLIFSYMKMLDPTSTVREGEFANAESAGGVPARLRAQYNKLLNGERLESSQRADFVKQSGAIFGERQKQADSTRKRYTTLATRAGVDPIDVVGEMEGGAQRSGAPQVGAVEDGYRFNGGDPADQKSWSKL